MPINWIFRGCLFLKIKHKSESFPLPSIYLYLGHCNVLLSLALITSSRRVSVSCPYYSWKEASELQLHRLKPSLATKILARASPSDHSHQPKWPLCDTEFPLRSSWACIFPFPILSFSYTCLTKQNWDNPLFPSVQWHMLRPHNFLFF